MLCCACSKMSSNYHVFIARLAMFHGVLFCVRCHYTLFCSLTYALVGCRTQQWRHSHSTYKMFSNSPSPRYDWMDWVMRVWRYVGRGGGMCWVKWIFWNPWHRNEPFFLGQELSIIDDKCTNTNSVNNYLQVWRTSYISDICRLFVLNETTFTRYCLTQSISKLPWSFHIHLVRQYLVNITGLVNDFFTVLGHGKMYMRFHITSILYLYASDNQWIMVISLFFKE